MFSESLFQKIILWNIWEKQILGVDVYHIASWFFIFSFFGWVWETCLVSIRTHKYVNRGFVSGPVCTIYGAGAVSVYLLLVPFSGNYLAIFFVGMIVATILEYCTSAVMETLFHAKWWDYSQHKFNIKGRICLGVSIGWGFMSLALFLLLMPVADWIMSFYSETVGEIGVCVAVALYIVDFSFTSVAAFNLEAHLQEIQSSMEELREKLRTSRPFEYIEDTLDEWSERKENSFTQMLDRRLDEFKKEALSKQDKISRRFLKSYPMLSKDLTEKREEIKKAAQEFKNRLEK